MILPLGYPFQERHQHTREYERTPPKSGAGAHEVEEDEEIWFVQPSKENAERGINVFKTLKKECEEERVKLFSECHSRRMGGHTFRLEHGKFSV